jgi:hypothetical protein
VERGRLARRTALLIHLQKRVLRAPAPDVLTAERYWILPNGFAVQYRVTPWSVRAARIPHGRELLPFYVRRVQRWAPAPRDSLGGRRRANHPAGLMGHGDKPAAAASPPPARNWHVLTPNQPSTRQPSTRRVTGIPAELA